LENPKQGEHNMTTIEALCKEKARSGFDRQAKDYDTSRYGEHARALYPHVMERLECFPYRSLLDVGCGTGAVLSMAAKHRVGARVAGVDLSFEMIKAARKKLDGRADLRIGDAEHLPWPDHTFDVVLCMDSFHHYPDPGRALSEMRRVVMPSGRLILGDCWVPTPFRQIVNLFLPFSKEGDVKIYSEGEVRTLLEDSGFTDIHWDRVTPRAYVVTAASGGKKGK
jgi:ubiquinone/menaquinone biosynthesis C-methylase UbiE